MSAKKTDTKSSKKAPKKRPVKHASKQAPKPAKSLSSKKATSKYCSSTSWGKGVSGNPAGRPPVRDSLAECFRDFLNGTEKGRIRKKLLIKRLFELTDGATSAVSAARLIIDTVSGIELEERLSKLEQQMEHIVGGGYRGGT